MQRIWQDLVAEYGHGHSYESVKRYVRRLGKTHRVVAGLGLLNERVVSLR